MNRRDALMLGAASLVVSAVVPASAQTKVDAQIVPKMKMTTDIPPSLTTPDKVENPHRNTQFHRRFSRQGHRR
jgi:hypothetical protein